MRLRPPRPPLSSAVTTWSVLSPNTFFTILRPSSSSTSARFTPPSTSDGSRLHRALERRGARRVRGVRAHAGEEAAGSASSTAFLAVASSTPSFAAMSPIGRSAMISSIPAIADSPIPAPAVGRPAFTLARPGTPCGRGWTMAPHAWTRRPAAISRARSGRGGGEAVEQQLEARLERPVGAGGAARRVRDEPAERLGRRLGRPDLVGRGEVEAEPSENASRIATTTSTSSSGKPAWCSARREMVVARDDGRVGDGLADDERDEVGVLGVQPPLLAEGPRHDLVPRAGRAVRGCTVRRAGLA